MKNIIKQNNVAVVRLGLQRAAAFTLLLLLSVGVWAQSTPRFAVDLDVSGRQSKEVTEPGWIPWVFNASGKNAYTDSITNEGIKVVISHKGNVGYGLRTSWYKTGVQAPYYARMANDGLTIDMGASAEVGGGHIELRLSGLKRAEHTIAIYLNNFSKLENEITDEDGNTIVVSKKTVSPVEVYANGLLYTTVSQSNRVESNYDAAIAYVRFTPQAYRDYVIDLKIPVNNTDSVKNISISGFELNAPDPEKQAWNPIPTDRDEHVDADNNKPITLRWNKSKDGSAVSYEVYYGKDFTEIDTADKSSATFKGTQTDTTFTVNNLYSMDTYYWKVNTIDADGDITEGNVWTFRPRILAFRGAEGYGRYARGGRGGKVVEVTNLNERGSGSLRAAIDSIDGPTIIVFSVSGTINLAAFKERISLSSSYVTVAGQTAPGKGICVRGAPFGISGGNDNIIRFMRVRLGQNNYTADGMGMAGTNFSIIDHSSISWTIDEAFSSRGGKSMTLQNTLISEALHVAGHQNYGSGSGHGYAATIGGDTASFLRNLLAHNHGRNWSLGGGLDGNGFYSGHLDIMNNIVYNYGGRVTDGGAHEVNFVNNYYKAGRHSTSGMLKAQHEGVGKGTQRYHAVGNVLENYNNGNYGTFTCKDDSPDSCGCSNQWSSGEAVRYQSYLPEPFFPSHATKYKATDAFKIVLSDVGCNHIIDEHDYRVILETRDGKTTYRGSYTGNYGIPDHHNDVGGYEEYPEVYRAADFDSDHDGLPDWWEKIHGTNPYSEPGDFTDTNTDPNGDGYTYMDHYLEFLAMPNYTTNKNRQVSIDLSQLTLGFNNLSPVYTVDGQVENGSVEIDGKWARFTPDNNFAGLAFFDFKVTDSEGTTMVRKIGIHVEQ